MNDRFKASLDAKSREKARVDNIIKKDIEYAADELERQEARQRQRNGDFTQLEATVLGPTPEWRQQTEHQPFTPDAIQGTVRAPKTIRAVTTPAVIRMWRRGKLTDHQAAACMWLRFIFDQSGVEGRYASSQMKERTTAGVATAFAGHIPITIAEADARRAYRSAVAILPKSKQDFFLQVVTRDASIHSVWQLSRGPRSEVYDRFRAVAQRLCSHCEAAELDFDLILKHAMSS